MADPHGAVRDRIRNCYASWMNTPDAGRIRVRWYKIPTVPGVYELTDYSSSNFDADPNSFNPPIGEESSSRSPFLDWRDCCPPPWPEPDGEPCEVAVGMPWAAYAVGPVTFTGSAVGGFTTPPAVLRQVGSCNWQSGPLPGMPFHFEWVLDCGLGSRMVLTARAVFPFLPDNSVAWWSPPQTDPGGNFSLFYQPQTEDGLVSGGFIIGKGRPRGFIAVDRCTALMTGAGQFIYVT